MLIVMKQVFIVLLSFSSPLAIKCVSLNNEPCIIRPTLIDLNPVELKPCMISLDKCSESCNVLSPKIYIRRETRYMNVKAFNLIINTNEAKTMAKHVLCDSKCKFNSTTCNSNRKCDDETYQCECKNDRTCKKDSSWNHITCTCKNRKYLKSIANTSGITCDEVIFVMDIVSSKMKNTIATNVSINSNDKIDCYILHTVLLVIILLLTIAIICYH